METRKPARLFSMGRACSDPVKFYFPFFFLFFNLSIPQTLLEVVLIYKGAVPFNDNPFFYRGTTLVLFFWANTTCGEPVDHSRMQMVVFYKTVKSKLY